MKKILTNTRFALLLILGGVAFTLIAAEYESFALTIFARCKGSLSPLSPIFSQDIGTQKEGFRSGTSGRKTDNL